ncbi:MAG: Ig-like domain-containing protein [Candidatus Aminicenantes bacterium]|nr:Ig-like domain-containing protein [Candidatus Aminicenantes bacterium]
MKKSIIVNIALLVGLLFSFSQTVTAEKKETFVDRANVMVVNRSDYQLENKIYTQAEIEIAKKKRQQWLEKDQEKDRQRAEAAKFASAGDLDAIQAVAITAQTGTFNAMQDASSSFILLGEVKNTGTTPAVFVGITVKMYDGGNNLFDTRSTYIDGGSVVQLSASGMYTNALNAGETGFFELYTPTNYADVARYTYTFDYSTISFTPAKAALQLSGSPVFSEFYSKIKITGDIKNTGCCYLTYFTKVYAAVYNDAGKVIDVSEADVTGSDYKYDGTTTHTAIAPGATESFLLYASAPYSGFSSYTYKYAFQWSEVLVYTLTVQSSPGTLANITVSPSDNNGNGSGYTNFTRNYKPGTPVAITAPSSLNGGAFIKWTVDGTANTSRTINVTMNGSHTVVAVFGTPTVTTYTLSVQSSGVAGVAITVSPADQTASSGGTTNFTRTYVANKSVTLTAPSKSGEKYFAGWTVAGADSISRTVTVTMNKNITASANYTSTPPTISLNRSALYFGYVFSKATPAPQTFIIANGGGGTLDWKIYEHYDAIVCTPGNGIDGAIVTVSIDPGEYFPGSYYGDLNITNRDPYSAQYLTVYLEVMWAVQNQAPIGDFATPTDGSTVGSSVAVTGWAVDDIGVDSVKIYYENGAGLGYIGDAVFVDGARPDIQAAYPTYPGSYKAGWGYMLLTNFLPNGDGEYKLHAIASDSEGKTTDLGTKTITVDNIHAVKPFGAIDTPGQGGTASGAKFSNVGWILTPQPNSIPTNGSTIDVYVDGVNKGHPVYNIYRPDIAGFFPGYANSDGSMAQFNIDTTAYETGYHSMFWIATDNAGNADGIGSRFFTIENAGSADSAPANDGQDERLKPVTDNADSPTGGDFVPDSLHQSYACIPVDHVTPIKVKKSFSGPAIYRDVFPDENGISHIDIKENELIEIDFSQLMGNGAGISGYLETGARLTALPLGSTLDRGKGKFCWLPVAGFMGDYNLTFIAASKGGVIRKDIRITISPKFDNKIDVLESPLSIR